MQVSGRRGARDGLPGLVRIRAVEWVEMADGIAIGESSA